MTQRYYLQIYWHFTGSPKGMDWSNIRKPADILKHGPVREPFKATEVLKEILRTKKLLATAVEKISDKFETKKFCCVTDIPFKDLPEHTIYYGAAAIGFRAKAIHRSFVPVLYIPEENLPVIEFLAVPTAPTFEDAMFENGLFGDDMLRGSAFNYLPKRKMLEYQRKLEEHARKRETAKHEIDEIQHGYLKNYLKITNFNTSPDQTFYREREWRCLADFIFSIDDIAALIVNEEFLPTLSSFVSNELGSAKNISCLSWDLVRNS